MRKIKTLFQGIPLSLLFISLLFFAIPIEHKYDKIFRFYSRSLLPEGIELPSFFDQKLYFYLSDLVILGLFIWRFRRGKEWLRHRTAFLAGVLFTCALISLVISPLANYPVAYSRLLQFATPLALFLLLAGGTFDRNLLFRIVSWSLCSTGVLQSLIAISQYFSQHSLGLRLLGEPKLAPAIYVPEGHLWSFDLWLGHSVDRSLIYRAMGTMTHSNALGGLLFITLLITGYLFFVHVKWRKWLSLAYFLQLFALGTSFSRSGFFAYVLATTVWLVTVRWKQNCSIRAPLVLILISVLIVGSLLYEQYLHRGGIVNYTPLTQGADNVRLFYQHVAIDMLKTHPLFGVGYGQFCLGEIPFFPPDADPSMLPGYVHNIYLLIATETGLIALVAFLSWITILLVSVLRRPPEKYPWGAIFLGLLFIGFCDFYPLFSQQGKLLFFGIAGLLACPKDQTLQQGPARAA